MNAGPLAPARPEGPHRPLLIGEDWRSALRTHVQSAWDLTGWLFSGLADDAVFQLQPDPRRNPLIFYFGHTAAFSLNKLGLAGLIEAPLDARLQQLLAVGVDPAAASDLDTDHPWPTAAEVRDFRRAALPLVLGAIDELEQPPAWDRPGWSVLMGIEHDRIHFETSSVLFRQLASDKVRPPEGWSLASHGAATPTNGRVDLPGGPVLLGKPDQPDTYGWDNEYGQLEVDVAPFTVSEALVSNGAFNEFLLSGGYADPRWWSEAGWAWRSAGSRTRPPFWRGTAEQPSLRGVFQEIPLPLDWPAEVTFHEASAYARWAGARLPTEAEWGALSADMSREQGDAACHPAHHLHLASCSPRGTHSGTPTPSGIHDPVGNVWQWLSDDFRPLPGFRSHPWYADFSEPYFDAEHKTLRGGSWASTGSTASEFYRLWFRPGFLQHAGFRLAWDRS